MNIKYITKVANIYTAESDWYEIVYKSSNINAPTIVN